MILHINNIKFDEDDLSSHFDWADSYEVQREMVLTRINPEDLKGAVQKDLEKQLLFAVACGDVYKVK